MSVSSCPERGSDGAKDSMVRKPTFSSGVARSGREDADRGPGEKDSDVLDASR
jgi:hypothetical protein